MQDTGNYSRVTMIAWSCVGLVGCAGQIDSSAADGSPSSTDGTPRADGVPGLDGPPPACDPDSDWLARSTAPGVVLATNFASAAERDDKYRHPDSRMPYVTYASDESASGGYSVRFEIPSNSPENSSGSWKRNFGPSPANNVKFGAGEEFYVQWRQRFSASMLDTVYEVTSGSGGWKQVIIGEGDAPGWDYGDAMEAGSCSRLEFVVVNGSRRAFPIAYHSCGDYWPYYEDFASEYNNYDFKLQNAVDSGQGSDRERFVLYSQEQGAVTQPRADFPGLAYHPNEWMTFQVHIALGPLGTARDPVIGAARSGFTQSTVELWGARQNQPLRPLVAFGGVVLQRDDGAQDTDERYGKIWLTPFHTGKDPAQSHPTGYTWYDEVIVSSQPIAGPCHN